MTNEHHAAIFWLVGVAKQIELLRVKTAYCQWHHWASEEFSPVFILTGRKIESIFFNVNPNRTRWTTEATHHQTEQRNIAILCYEVPEAALYCLLIAVGLELFLNLVAGGAEPD